MPSTKVTKKSDVVLEAVQYKNNNEEEIAAFMGVPYEGTMPILEGNVQPKNSDWVIRGSQGEFYPCKNSDFVKDYDVQGGPNRSEIFVTNKNLSEIADFLDDSVCLDRSGQEIRSTSITARVGDWIVRENCAFRVDPLGERME